ncbi:MAG: RNA polymerase sigma-70 factor [Cytophagales bacterium]|nr:RNA polymerase sigma-70 factor [Cytophagales bacterium]
MSSASQTESALVQQVADGDERAFEQLFLQYKDKLYSFSLRYTRSAFLAEEIVQEAFVKVWHHRRTLDPRQCFGAYLFRLTRNQLLNHLKRIAFEAAYRKQVARQADTSAHSTDNLLLNAEYEQITQRAIGHLPPQRQAIFRMSRLDGLSHEEIAQALHISPHTVKVQINKALKTIRRHLQVYTDLTLLVLWWLGG